MSGVIISDKNGASEFVPEQVAGGTHAAERVDHPGRSLSVRVEEVQRTIQKALRTAQGRRRY